MLKTCKQDCWQLLASQNLIFVVAEPQEVQIKDYRFPDNLILVVAEPQEVQI